MNEAVDGAFISVGVLAISFISKKLGAGKMIEQSPTVLGGLKLAASITASTVAVRYAQKKGWLTDNPFK